MADARETLARIPDGEAGLIQVTGSLTVNDMDLFITGPGGNDLGAATGSTNAETVTVGGERPLSDYAIQVRGCSGAGDVAVSASGTVHWVPSDAELLAEPAPLNMGAASIVKGGCL